MPCFPDYPITPLGGDLEGWVDQNACRLLVLELYLYLSLELLLEYVQ